MKYGFACGVFDLFHPGHVLMLEECKKQCDYLIVALNSAQNLSPSKNQPIMNLEERRLILLSCRFVDEVIVYNSEAELLKIIQERQIDIRFLGEDYINMPITGSEVGIPIHFINRGHGYSTSVLIKRIKDRN